MKPLLLALTLLLTTYIVCLQVIALPLPTVGNGSYTPFAKPPRPGKAAPHYNVTLVPSAKPEPTTGTTTIKSDAGGTISTLIRRPLVRSWYSYLPTLPKLRHYHLSSLPGYNFADPLAVNHHHTLVGYYGGGGSGAYLVVLAKAFLWQKGRMQLLETLPGYQITHAVAINDYGLIAGDGTCDSFPASMDTLGHALLWSHGYRYDLNDCIPPRSGWVLSTATAIDGRGKIVGYGLFHAKKQAFLLTPQRRETHR